MIYYLNADTGDDSTGDGSSSTPWLTISKAHTEASSGDTIICQDSTATYTFIDQAFTKALTIEGESTDGSGAIFDGGGTLNEVAWTLVDGMTFKKATFQNCRSEATSSTGIFNSQNLLTDPEYTFENCIFQNMLIENQSINGGGICSNGEQNYTVNYTGCLFNKLASMNPHTGSNDSSYITSGREYIANFTNCTFYFDETGDDCIDGITYPRNGYATIFYIKNCIFESSGDAIPVSASTANVASTYNYSCAYVVTSSVTGDGNITSDPLFVDSANGNFNLRPSSPCFDTATLL